jgi:phosphohistidine phosphatase SixA
MTQHKKRSLLRGACASVAVIAIGLLDPLLTSTAAAYDRNAGALKQQPAFDEIITMLRTGGHVLLIRHTTAPGTGDPANFKIGDCSTQRNLDAKGRSEATRLGEAIRSHNIPIAETLSSQWCRTLETARLTGLADGSVTPWAALNSSFDASTAERDARASQLRERVNALSSQTKNTAVFTHAFNIDDAYGVWLETGEVLVVKAGDARGGLVAKLKLLK